MTLLLLLWLLTSNLHATDFLLNPSKEDLTQLSHLYQETGKPVPIHFTADPNNLDLLTYGVALSNRVRNGVHARLLVTAGAVKKISEVKTTNHGHYSGTLFLEIQGGKPVLSVHKRNSTRSTANTKINGRAASFVLPASFVYSIYIKTGLQVVNASEDLNRTIENINYERYVNHLTDPLEIESAISKNGLENKIEFRVPTYRLGSISPNIINNLKTSTFNLLDSIYTTKRRIQRKEDIKLFEQLAWVIKANKQNNPELVDKIIQLHQQKNHSCKATIQ